MTAQILLIEDDSSLAASLRKVLSAEGYQTQLASRGDEGLAQALASSYDLVITDLRLPGLDGLELVRQLHAAKPKLPIVMMTAHGTTETAIEATKLGVCEYVLKPAEPDELLAIVALAVRQSKLMSEPVEFGEADSPRLAIIGKGRAMQNIYKEVGRVAATPVTVLLRGQTGTGKELIARAIYQHSNRSDKPFIAINCAAIPETLLESELFGHERGAFTGAHTRRIGRFEQANGGTIFLDEIGDLSLNTQSRLLRVLQEKCLSRVGGDEVIPVDVRVLSATHRDLELAIREREFREDLYYRLAVVTIALPSLAERTEDIPDLIKYFVQRHARELSINSPAIQPEALAWMQTQPWPGNVRQLENVIRQALLLAQPFAVNPGHVQEVMRRNKPAPAAAAQTHAEYISQLLQRAQQGETTNAYAQMIADLEAELFLQAIRLANGNQAKAARWLGITRLKMRERLTELGLHPRATPENDASNLSQDL
jgi:DNA-binding NtrC family response regulator